MLSYRVMASGEPILPSSIIVSDQPLFSSYLLVESDQSLSFYCIGVIDQPLLCMTNLCFHPSLLPWVSNFVTSCHVVASDQPYRHSTSKLWVANLSCYPT